MQIAITDGIHLYVLNYTLNPLAFGVLQTSSYNASDPATWSSPDTTYEWIFFVAFVNPGYISFQLSRLIVVDTSSQDFWLSGINDAMQWNPTDVTNQAYFDSISLKPDHIQAAVPLPGGGNNLALFGHTVMELWQFTGDAIFPYQRQSTYNIDYGCLNSV